MISWRVRAHRTGGRVASLGPRHALMLAVAGVLLLPLVLVVLCVAVFAGLVFLLLHVVLRVLSGALGGPRPGPQGPEPDDGRRNVRVISDDR